MDKPKVKLTGGDGNAFTILGRCRKAAKRAGWGEDRIRALFDEMTAGDYENLLAVAMRNFEVE